MKGTKSQKGGTGGQQEKLQRNVNITLIYWWRFCTSCTTNARLCTYVMKLSYFKDKSFLLQNVLYAIWYLLWGHDKKEKEKKILSTVAVNNAIKWNTSESAKSYDYKHLATRAFYFAGRSGRVISQFQFLLTSSKNTHLDVEKNPYSIVWKHTVKPLVSVAQS